MKRFSVALSLGVVSLLAVAASDEISTTFTYSDPNADSVALAGEFSNWEQLAMTKDASGVWSKTVSLKPGYYGYKFVVNAKDWVFDPKNAARKKDGEYENSAISVGGAQPAASGGKLPVVFHYADSKAKTVHLAGEFNDWLDNVDGKVSGKNEWLLQSDSAGNWKYTAQLPPGRYKFKYVIDGERWEQDPKAPASNDGNSIIEVKPGAAVETVSVDFRYTDPNANAVFLAGEFNQWSTTANPMNKNESGVWSASLSLQPGSYPYKFVVDSAWKQDPDNPEALPDGLGGSNSVKVVTQ